MKARKRQAFPGFSPRDNGSKPHLKVRASFHVWDMRGATRNEIFFLFEVLVHTWKSIDTGMETIGRTRRSIENINDNRKYIIAKMVAQLVDVQFISL